MFKFKKSDKKIPDMTKISVVNTEGCDLQKTTKVLLIDAKANLSNRKYVSMPISKLSTLGAGVAVLNPALRTVSQSTTVASQGLYKLANANVGDTLKIARNGNFWGAFKTAEGGSKFAQLQAVEPVSTTTTMDAISWSSMAVMTVLPSSKKRIVGTSSGACRRAGASARNRL